MNWWTPSTPDEIKPVPWMHPAAVLYLESLLTSDMTVIEHGCGGSTLWLAHRVKEVHSVDHSKDWREAVKRQMYARVYLYLSLAEIKETHCDLLLIDGYGADRPKWIKAASNLVKPGGIVVVDNSERSTYQGALEALQLHCIPPLYITGCATGLNNKLVQTSFYRLKGGESWI